MDWAPFDDRVSYANPALADYAGLTDVALRSRTEAGRGLYIAESQFVESIQR